MGLKIWSIIETCDEVEFGSELEPRKCVRIVGQGHPKGGEIQTLASKQAFNW